jgi:hypothetical protein
MNWDALGAVAELGGAIGVIATLFYLALQIRRSAAVENANAYDNLVNGWHNATALLLDSENRATFLKAIDGYDELSEDERFQFHVLVAKLLDRFESMLQFRFLRVTNRIHPAEQYTPMIADFMSSDGFQKFWKAEHLYYSPAMSSRMKEHCPHLDSSEEVGFAARIKSG